MQHWFAVQSKPRQERVAQEHLQRQGFTTYLPMLSVRRQRRGQWQAVVEPLFPRYLFIQLDINQQSLAPVRSTRGVAQLVRFGHLLHAVPDSVIVYLKQQESSITDTREDDALPFKAGDEVRLLDGPFAGLTGIYTATEADQRALLLVELLGRENELVVDLNSLAEV